MSRIFTASFFAKDDWHDPSGDNVFSIANAQPRGFGLPLLYLFRPGDCLKDFRIHRDWKRYEREYKRLLCKREPEIRARIHCLRWEGDITLCCWEADPSECHRKWAAEWLATELGCEVTVL